MSTTVSIERVDPVTEVDNSRVQPAQSLAQGA
jgi:hypothetical protein